MSDIPADYRDRLDLREQLARIDQQREETLKFTAEQHKLMAERDKFNREPWVLVLAALIGAFAVLLAQLPEILRAMGVGP